MSANGNVLATGVISAQGNITGGNLNASGLSLSSNVVSALNVTGNIASGNITTPGLISAVGNITASNLNAAGLSLSSNVVGDLNVTGNVAGNYFVGNGSALTGITSSYGNANVATLLANFGSNTISTSGNITGGNLLFGAGAVSGTGNITGGNVLFGAGIVSGTGNITGGNANITSTTASTSKTTGALTVAGGVGVAADLYVGNSLVVDNGSYGNVTTTQFASVFASGVGPNPYSIMQVRSNDGVSGLGMQAFPGSGTLYGNAVINFALATIRDKDIPTSLVIKANINSTGLNVTGIVSASGNVTGGNVLTGGQVSATGNVRGNNLISSSIVGSRSNVGISTDTVIDSFPTGAYRTAKYVISSKSDGGYQSVEVLLVQDGSSSFVTIYGSISTVSSDIISLSSNIASGNVILYASTIQTNCTVNLIGTYVTD
jgi:hypothetical protein